MTKFTYRPRSGIDLRLRILKYTVQNDTYRTTLHAIADGIKAAASRVDRAEKSGPEEFREGVIDTETQLIEGLLGAAFVVCQTQITAVAQEALRCGKQATRDRLPLPASGAADYEVRKLGPLFDANWSKIEVLWALANYFKHRDQWTSHTWAKSHGKEARTIAAISAAGLSERSTGNLRDGAKALGNHDFVSVDAFVDIIEAWSKEVYEVVEKTCP